MPSIEEAPPAQAMAAAGTAHRIVVDPVWGYRRLDPLPSGGDLDAFYESQYRDLLDAGGRAPDLARLVGGGPEAEREREWQAATIHADVLAALEEGVAEGAPRRVLDVGCGTGDLLRTLASAGWEAIGTEPASEIAEMGRASGLHIEVATAADYLAAWQRSGAAKFGGIVLLNVLEHVLDPASLLLSLAPALAPGGRLVVRVPNDFNPLQTAARSMLGGDPWWIAAPDHVNYFDHASIGALVERAGFEVVHRSADFPMELFLLMGDDYRTDPALGHDVHERRRRAEMALETTTRRALGQAWAAAGVGRNALVIARWPG